MRTLPARWAALALVLTTAGPAVAQIASEPPPETEQFARLAGTWTIEMEVRQEDGTWADEPVEARWVFRTILGGHAVQDHWSRPADDPAEGTNYGTNVRIYDPEAGHWKVAWTASDDRDFMLLTARMEGGDRLRVYGMHDAGIPLRVTFYDVTDTTFRWSMEMPRRDGEGWVDISRMRAMRVEE